MGTLFLTKEARIYNGAKTASSINGAGKIGQLHVKNEIRKLPNTTQPHTKINSKWIEDLNVRPETTKLLEENIRRTLDRNETKILYDPPPRVSEIKTKVNKWDLIKIKSICTARESISKVKKTPLNGRK